MDQSFQVLAEFDEGAEINHAGHLALNDVAVLVVRDDGRLLLGPSRLFRDDQLVVGLVDVKHFDPHRLADELLERFQNALLVAALDPRVVLGGQLRDGQETVDAVDFDHQTAAVSVEHGDVDDLAGLLETEQFIPGLLVTGRTEGQLHDPLFVLQVEDGGVDRIAGF